MTGHTAEKAHATVSLENMTLEELLAKAKEDNHPWLPAIGIFQDDAVFAEWVEIMRENRRKADEYLEAL